MNGMIIFLFSGLIIIGILLLVIIATTRKSPKGINQEEFRSKWLKITSSLNDTEESRHLAVLNADKLLDQALKAKGVKGETMGERLKNTKSQLRHRDAIWTAHKLRNQIAHEDSVSVSDEQAKRALAAFKSALKDIGAL